MGDHQLDLFMKLLTMNPIKSSAFQRFKESFYTMPPGFKLQTRSWGDYRWSDGFLKSDNSRWKFLICRDAWEQYWYRQNREPGPWYNVD